jgi:hypothetical protein
VSIETAMYRQLIIKICFRKYQKLLLLTKAKQTVMREYIIELLKYENDEELLNSFKNWEVPKFYHIAIPMLNRNGANLPKFYAMIINELKTIWAEHDFKLSIEEIEKLIPDAAAKFERIGNVRRNMKN